MDWSKIVIAATMATAVSGCASVPSYYADRVGSGRAVAVAPVIDEEPAPATPRRARARRTSPSTAAVAQAPLSEPENTGASGAALPAPSAEDQRTTQRERAINRSINSICRGC